MTTDDFESNKQAKNHKNPFKGLDHPKMKISPWFTHPQGILGVYIFLLSDESNWSYIKKCPGSSKLYKGSGSVFLICDECGSAEERAKQNTGQELEVQNEDL